MGIEGDVFLGPREEGGERKVVIVGDNSQKQAVGQQPQVTEGGEEGDWRRKSVSGKKKGEPPLREVFQGLVLSERIF